MTVASDIATLYRVLAQTQAASASSEPVQVLATDNHYSRSCSVTEIPREDGRMVEIGAAFAGWAMLFREKENLYRVETRLFRGQINTRSSGTLLLFRCANTVFYLIFVVRSFALFCSSFESERGPENENQQIRTGMFLKMFVIFDWNHGFDSTAAT